MSDEVNEMKYEGLAALIVTIEENHEKRHKDFKEFVDMRFNGLEEHNKKQNGNIGTAMKKIGELEREANKRKLTCGAAVETLQKQAKYVKFVMWIDQKWKLALFLFIGILLVTQAIVHAAVEHGWLSKLFELIKGIR